MLPGHSNRDRKKVFLHNMSRHESSDAGILREQEDEDGGPLFLGSTLKWDKGLQQNDASAAVFCIEVQR